MLAEIQGNIVLTFSDKGSSDELRFYMKILKARKAGHQGRLEDALSILLDCDTWRGITVTMYQQLAREVYDLLLVNSLRRGQREQLLAYLKGPLFNDGGENLPKEDSYFEELRKSMIGFRENPLPASSLQVLLSALWDTEFLGHFMGHRIALVGLADLGLVLRTEKKSLGWLEDVMPQVTNGDDLELRAFTCFTMARTVVVTGKGEESALQQAVTHLTQAEQDYSTLGSLHALMQVQGFLSMVYHRLGLMDERDGVAGRHSQTSAESERLRKSEVDDEVKHVWETVQMIGSVIGSRNHKLVQ